MQVQGLGLQSQAVLHSAPVLKEIPLALSFPPSRRSCFPSGVCFAVPTQFILTTLPFCSSISPPLIFPLAGDLGGCEGAQLMRIRNQTENATWITAWGLTRKHPKVWWPGCHRPGLVSSELCMGPCRVHAKWPGI